jgi:multicomponent Na+:H+ antiporter subunit G
MAGLALLALLEHGVSVASTLNCLKIVLIVVFIYITSPTATHAIVDAGVRAGLLPWAKDSREDST